MSGTLRRVRVAIVVRDDQDEDAVVDELNAVVQEAVSAWYAERGHQLLMCEP